MGDRTSGRRHPPARAALALGITVALALIPVMAGCSGTGSGAAGPAARPTRAGVDAPAPTPDQIVRDGVRTALKTSTAHFSFAVASTQKGYRSRANGSGTVDLAHGRLDTVQNVRSPNANWQSRYLLVGRQAYVKNLTEPQKGAWWRSPVNQQGSTFTRDGYADPMEFLRLLLTLDPGVTVLGDRVIQGDDVVGYRGTARPTKAIAAGYDRPGRKPGQLAGNLKYLGVGTVAVRVYLDGKGLPMRITLSGKGRPVAGVSPTVTATLTTVGWGTPAPIRRPTFDVPTFDELYG